MMVLKVINGKGVSGQDHMSGFTNMKTLICFISHFAN
jgi:hypothetical protein